MREKGDRQRQIISPVAKCSPTSRGISGPACAQPYLLLKGKKGRMQAHTEESFPEMRFKLPIFPNYKTSQKTNQFISCLAPGLFFQMLVLNFKKFRLSLFLEPLGGLIDRIHDKETLRQLFYNEKSQNIATLLLFHKDSIICDFARVNTGKLSLPPLLLLKYFNQITREVAQQIASKIQKFYCHNFSPGNVSARMGVISTKWGSCLTMIQNY